MALADDRVLEGPHEFATATLLESGDVLVQGGFGERIETSAVAWLVRGNTSNENNED